jgi:hypothetical protein
MAGDREEAAIRDRTGVGETKTPFPCPDVRVERERACHAVVGAPSLLLSCCLLLRPLCSLSFTPLSPVCV